MWEIIRANKQKSIVLFIAMAFCLLILGYAIGSAIEPNVGGFYGAIAAGLIWIALSLVSYYSGDSILLSSSNATEVTSDIHPQLFNVVEEMKIAANLPKLPKIYIMDDDQPNAFATGRNPECASVAVTTGLLSRLNRDELQGVVAHEVSHILNRDILYVTCAGVMLGSVAIISEIFLRGFRGGSLIRRYKPSKRNVNQGQAILIFIAVAAAILAPILVRLLYFSLSRRREYLADASGARLTRYPEGLASALEKISASKVASVTASQVTAPMYIVNPLQAAGSAFSGFWSTHPPTSERVQILRAMSQGVNFSSYEQAFQQVRGRGNGILPKSALANRDVVAVRAPSLENEKEEKSHSDPKPNEKESARKLGDLRRAIHRYAFVTCQCGLKFKIPPNFARSSILCPRCFFQVQIPHLHALESSKEGSDSLFYERRSRNWESFQCECGHLIQLSPQFLGSHINCAQCQKSIQIKNSERVPR